MATLRALLAVLAGAITMALGALILGEYEFTGLLPFVAGPLFGLVVAEVVIGVAQLRTGLVAAIAAELAFTGIAWAGWIDSTQGVEPMKTVVWVAACLAATVAAVRTLGVPGRESPAQSTATAPTGSHLLGGDDRARGHIEHDEGPA